MKNKFIENLNTLLGTICMFTSLYGLVIENYFMACAYSLFFIAYQQATEEQK